MTREEWLEFHAGRAPEITDEQWRDTLTILALSRNRGRAVVGVPLRLSGLQDPDAR